MGILYRETIIRRRTPVVFFIATIIFAMSIIESLIDEMYIKNEQVTQYLDTSLIVVTGTIIIYEILKCRVVYKYSIVENRLIINKVCGDKSTTVEKVLFQDMIYIGKPFNCKKGPIIGKKHVGNNLSGKTICCVYKINDKLKKFYFQPSECMMRKIERIKQA